MPFKVKKRISESSAHNMVLEMAFHGNHYKDENGLLRNSSCVKDHFRQNGMNFTQEVNKCRDFKKYVPMYENLVGPTWHTNGLTVSKINAVSQKYEPVLVGDGSYNESNYWAIFEIAKEDFCQAIASGSYERLLSAINAGIAAIESFLNQQYADYTAAKLDPQNLDKQLDTKIDEWPLLITGRKFNKSTKSWCYFKYLRNLRNEDFQHRKVGSSGIAHTELLDIFNKFKSGICLTLYELHLCFNMRCPSQIIRYAHFPEIEYESGQISLSR